jgi:hypothetical protein
MLARRSKFCRLKPAEFVFHDSYFTIGQQNPSGVQNRGANRRHAGIVGTLLAFVAKESFAAGCDGFVVFVSKTALFEYYRQHYGAKPLGGLKLHFDTEASELRHSTGWPSL